jgi:hypothetical protein
LTTGARGLGRFGRWLAAGAGLAAAAYVTCVAAAWLRYGCGAAPEDDEADALLDRFMPVYEVAERHRIRVAAPAGVTLAAASEIDLTRPWLARAIFTAREWILGSTPDTAARPRALLDLATSIGWGVLAERAGREIVMGAVTQPWLANVVFRPLPPDEFAAFHEPGFVKIVWTLRADPDGEARSVFRTETRVATTDPGARGKFRRYWSFFSPGIVLIRRVMLNPLKTEAERRARLLPRS